MIVLSHDNEILTHDGAVLYAPEISVLPVSEYFIGVIPFSTTPTRPTSVDIGSLLRVQESTNQAIITVKFSDVAGWLVIAESVQAPLRNYWRVTSVNQGAIGGSWEDLNPNLFPDPVFAAFESKAWRVYLSSYVTIIFDPIQFIAL